MHFNKVQNIYYFYGTNNIEQISNIVMACMRSMATSLGHSKMLQYIYSINVQIRYLGRYILRIKTKDRIFA